MRAFITLSVLMFLITSCSNQDTIENSFHLQAQTGRVKKMPFYDTCSGYGRIEPFRTTVLTAKFDGHFRLVAPEKESYQKGDIIYQLTGPEVQLQKELLSSQRIKARAAFNFQKELLQRKMDLQRKQFIPVDEWEKLQRDYQVAFSQYCKTDSAYQYFLSATNYQAPFNGYLTDLSVRQGDFIHKDQKIGNFASIAGIKLVGVIFGNASSLAPDSLYEIILNDSIQTQGKLLFLENSINPKTGGRKFWITLNSDNPKIWSGAFAKYEIKFNKQQAPGVPASALLFEKKRYYVVTKTGNLYRNVAVKIGRRESNFVELVEGPPINTEVVTQGAFEIFHWNLKNTLKIED